MKFKKYVEEKEGKKSKTEMYLDYYKNLTPKGFKVTKDKNKIVIEIK
jgi:hypothetical protein